MADPFELVSGKSFPGIREVLHVVIQEGERIVELKEPLVVAADRAAHDVAIVGILFADDEEFHGGRAKNS